MPLLRTCFIALSALSAVFAPASYQIEGRILQADGKPFRGVVPYIFLDSAYSPFAARTTADASGAFKLRDLSPGTYNIVIYVPRNGEIRRTIEVGPAFADGKGRIPVTFRLQKRALPQDAYSVSAAQLAISAQAKREYLRGMDYLASKEIDKAIACFEKAVEIAPQFVGAWNHLGTVAYTSRRHEDAERYFRIALSKDPGAYEPLVNLGGTLLALDRVAESTEINQQAVRMRPDDPLAHSQLGQSYYFSGEFEQAEVQLRHARSLDPGHFTLPQLLLAAIYERRGDYRGVIRELEDFLTLHPDSERAPLVRERLDAARRQLKSAAPPQRNRPSQGRRAQTASNSRDASKSSKA